MNDVPLQIDPELTATVGLVLTVTVAIAVFEQPDVVPVIVYEVVVPGLTIAAPPVYTYVDAPDADIVNDLPAQIDPELTATVGLELTVTVAIAVLEQPAALVPVTVYEVLVVGETDILEVV